MVNTTADMIRSRLNRGTMTYSVYSPISGLLTELYEAQWDAVHDEPCLLTEIKYITDSTNVLATKETVVGWNSAWDFDSL